MAIVEWHVPFSIVSQFGTLTLNAASGDRYLLAPDSCSSGAELRVQIDNIPTGDGGIVHDVYSSYYIATLAMQLRVDDAPACGEDLNRMFQTLTRHLLGMRREVGRLYWTPTGYAQRLLDNVILTARPTHTLEGELLSLVSFTVASPFPYAITAAQTTTTILDGASATLVNDGDTDTYPVVKVYGPTAEFYITNITTGMLLHYNSSLPGAVAIGPGDYVELDFFRDTAYLNGSGANRKPGINVIESDFFPITPEPTGNQISLAGASADILWNQAWG